MVEPQDKAIRSTRAGGRFQSAAGQVHHRLKQLRPALAFAPAGQECEP